jgi:serine-type D-Ala-D-Ala carboxypeptidase (penicillin-binding protein 5/6)
MSMSSRMRVRQPTSMACAILLLVLAPNAVARPGAAPATISTSIWLVHGHAPAFSWPATGQAAVAVADVGPVGSSPGEVRVPIASLTKMMTAIVVLRDHPLIPGRAEPLITFGSDDVSEWRKERRAGDSVAEVRAGETLTEYQALEALLVPSADNVAERLARWDSGTISRFVAKTNAQARALKLTSTRYADPSGLDPASSSTAIDQARVAAQLMQNAAARSIVRRTRINLPVVGVLPNRNPALSVDGIVGVKGGFTSRAHNCLVTAAFRLRHDALVVSVALDQPDALTAAHLDEALLREATPALHERTLFPVVRGDGLGFGLRIRSVAHRRVLTAVVWPGLIVRETVTAISGRSPALSGRVTVSTPWSKDGPLLVHVPLPVLPGSRTARRSP